MSIFNSYSEFEKACREGDISYVKSILTCDKVGTIMHRTDYTSLFGEVCLNNDIQMAQLLLNDPVIGSHIDINSSGYRQEYPPLHTACEMGNISMVKFLLSQEKINITKTDHCSRTAFCTACGTNYTDIVKLFLEDDRIQDVLDMPIFSAHVRPFYFACKNNQIDVIKILLEDDRINPNERIFDGQSVFDTGFHIACENGHIEVVKLLLENPRVNTDEISKENPSKCRYDTLFNHIEVAKLLLEDGRFDPNVANQLGYTPLRMACQKNSLKLVKLLLDDPRINDSNRGTDSAFHQICNLSNHTTDTGVKILKLLWEDPRTKLDTTSDSFYSSFQSACIMGNLGIVKLFLESPDFNPPPHIYRKIFDHPYLYGYYSILKLLLEDSRTDTSGSFPLIIAVYGGNVEAIKLLLQYDQFDPMAEDSHGCTLFLTACSYHKTELVKFLLNCDRIDPSISNKIGSNGFHRALCNENGSVYLCSNSHLTVVDILLEDGRVDPTQKDSNGKTPLEIGCACNNINGVKSILKKVPDLELPTLKKPVFNGNQEKFNLEFSEYATLYSLFDHYTKGEPI